MLMMQILMYAGRSRGVDTSARRPCIFSASFRGDQGGASSCARHGRLCEKLPGICTRGLRKSGTQRGGQRDCAREENRANAPKRRDMTGDRTSASAARHLCHQWAQYQERASA